jgi:hypothetical protein
MHDVKMRARARLYVQTQLSVTIGRKNNNNNKKDDSAKNKITEV